MKRLAYIFLILLLVIGGNTKAQFAKPLPKKQNPWNEAQLSVGIIGGLSATRWLHQGGTNTVYDQPITTIALDSTFLSSDSWYIICRPKNFVTNSFKRCLVEALRTPNSAAFSFTAIISRVAEFAT